MKPSSLPLQADKRNLSRDRIGILLLLTIGIAGQLIVILIPDPLKILAPQIPILTPRDWQESYIGTELIFTDNWRASYNVDTPWSPFVWDEKRGFFQTLYLEGDDFLSSVEQTVVWYADPIENANVWKKELDAGTYNSWPILESHLGSDQPASLLACNPAVASSPPQCWYLAYWNTGSLPFFSIDNPMGSFSLRNFSCRTSISLQHGQTSSSCLPRMSLVLDSFAPEGIEAWHKAICFCIAHSGFDFIVQDECSAAMQYMLEGRTKCLANSSLP